MPHKRSCRFLLVLTLSAVSTLAVARTPDSGLPTARPETVGMSSERLQRIDAFTQRYIDNQMVAGTVTLVARIQKHDGRG